MRSCLGCGRSTVAPRWSPPLLPCFSRCKCQLALASRSAESATSSLLPSLRYAMFRPLFSRPDGEYRPLHGARKESSRRSLVVSLREGFRSNLFSDLVARLLPAPDERGGDSDLSPAPRTSRLR